ncbi:hypothetical protein ACIRPX_21305 [Streptomyces sp. NPDC101225]|uniref:hypothetical protein n=1 Tax=Streptomyces sp. NPDC101225 TaxID=3366135 RepID=UPI0037FB134C
MRRISIALLACLGAALPMAVATSTAASASPVMTPAVPGRVQTTACNSGHVCIYKGDIWDDSPNHAKVYDFYYYGTYNVHDLIGDYTVLNCQFGGAGVKGFTGYDGTGRVAWDLSGNNCVGGLWTDLTSTYSVRLYA